MSDAINENRFMSAREDAWHRLGKVVPENFTMEDARRDVFTFELVKDEIINPYTGERTGFFGIYRNDNSDMLHVAKEGYEPSQYWEMLEFIDGFKGVQNGCHYETVGVLGKGEKAFATAFVGEFDLMASGDVHKKYFAAATSCNGSLADTFWLTDTRIVCQNTLNIALSEKSSKLKFRHSKNARERKADALMYLQATEAAALSLQEKFEVLAQREIDGEMLNEVLLHLFEVDTTKDLSLEKSEKILTVTQLFESNDNNAFPQFKNTAYGLANAITEFTDHFDNVRGGDQDTNKQRAYKSIFGSGATLKQRGIDLVLELTSGAKSVNQPKAFSYTEGQDIVAGLLNGQM